MVDSTCLEIERRVDRLRDLAERAQLGDRLRQFAGALLDLLFQVGVGFLEPSAHVVELVGEAFQFVAGLDRDALREIAAADPRRAGAQRLDRHHHAARQEHAGQHGEDQRGQQHVEPAGTAPHRASAYASSTGSSTNIRQPSGSIGADAVSTSRPWMFCATCRSSSRIVRIVVAGGRAPAAAATCRCCAAPG